MPTPLTLGFIQSHPRDAAHLVSQLPLRQVTQFLREVPANAIAMLIPHMPGSTSAHCIQSLDREVGASVIESLDIATAALVLRRVQPKTRRGILSALQTVKATPLQLVLDYPPGTVGSLMDPQAMTLSPDVTVEEALRQVRMSKHNTQHYFFVLGEEHHVLGYVSLHDLLFASKQSYVGTVMHTGVKLVHARSTIESIRHHDQWRDMDMLPVVNRRQAYLGVIRFAAIQRPSEADHRPPPAAFEIFWGLAEAGGAFLSALVTAPDLVHEQERHNDE